MKTFIFGDKNSSMTITISADNDDDALSEIWEYFENYGVSQLRLLEEVED